MYDEPRNRWTLVNLVRRQSERYGDRTFQTFEDGSTLTFAGLDRESERLAASLASLGLGAGDRLLGLLLNGPRFLPLMMAANKLGAIFVPVNTELRGAFLEHQVKNSAPRIVAVDVELARSFAGIDLGAAGVERVVVVGAGDASLDALGAATRMT